MYADNVKKMCHLKSELTTVNEIVGFTLPKLHRGKTWYVDFFAYDHAAGKMRRKKYMLDRYKARRERETVSAILIHNLIDKLRAGWNPFVNAGKTRQFAELPAVLERYKAFIQKQRDRGVMKQKTFFDYSSRLKHFELFLKETDTAAKYAYQFNAALAADFLDYLIYDKDVSAKTRNNYRTWLSTLGTWLKERQYIDANPCEGIHQLREEEKFRDALSPADLARLKDYLQCRKPAFYLACMMEYYCFIRPDELRYIKIGDISVKEQTVYVHPEFAKNRKGQVVALNDSVLKTMIGQKVFDHPSIEFLFGHEMTPGPKQIYVNQFRNEWRDVRKALGFPKSYQFYSLKDSGIRDLANAEGIVVARDQARHTDISVTNKYLKNVKFAHEETKHFKGKL